MQSQLHDNLQATKSQLLSNTSYRISSCVSIKKQSLRLGKHKPVLEVRWAGSFLTEMGPPHLG